MATRSASSNGAKDQIVAMLKADHQKVRKAFKTFEKLDPHEDPEECKALVDQTLAEVEVHAEIEEQLFYPAARGAIKKEDLIDEAEVEHMTAKVLIGQLKGMGPDDEKYAATFKVLGEYLDHHIQEEEGEIFKQLTQAGAEWDSVLQEMQAQREQLMQERGMPADDEEAGTSTRTGRGTAARGTGAPAGAESRPQAASKATKGSSSEKS